MIGLKHRTGCLSPQPGRFAADPASGAGQAPPPQGEGEVRPEEIGADGTFSGYASIFGKADLTGDLIEPGAFARSLRQRGPAGIRMLFQHDPAQPIGVWCDIREDRRGLVVTGRLTLEVGRAREVLSLLRAGAIDGLSIGFRTVRARADRRGGTRRLSEIDLWEISVVTFPMLPGARVARVKQTGGEAMAARAMRRAAAAARADR